MSGPWLEQAQLLDAADPLAGVRARFQLPEDLIYLDGNSLGALPRSVPQRLAEVAQHQWGSSLIGGWNEHSWIDLPIRVGDRVGALVGAASGQTLVADSISVNLVKLLAAALMLRPNRRVVLSTEDNFPTDLYMVQGLQRWLGEQRCELRVVAEADIEAALDDSVAVAMLTHVNFRTGRMLDMGAMTQAVHGCGALALWDLAHSAGAVPVALDEHAVDMAVGCGYKYLNGGPGAPAFLYVARRHHDRVQQPLSGWMGHARPFDFDPVYEPAAGIGRFAAGTPSILALSALDAALDAWEGVSMTALRAKSVGLTELFMAAIADDPVLGEFRLLSPRAADQRGSQVAYAHPQGYPIMQALIEAGVVGDFRAPDVLRFGFTPLYLRHADVAEAVRRLSDIVGSGRYREARFSERAAVT